LFHEARHNAFALRNYQKKRHIQPFFCPLENISSGLPSVQLIQKDIDSFQSQASMPESIHPYFLGARAFKKLGIEGLELQLKYLF
jgi:hypothetical protein